MTKPELGHESRNAGRGYLAGAFIGGIAGIGIDDAFFNSNLKFLNRRSQWAHAAGRSGIVGLVGGGAVGLNMASGGSLESALFWGGLAQMPGAMLAKRLIPCFPAGTPILTPDGSKPIEKLQAGDLVLSRDEHDVDGPVEAKVIEEAFTRHGEIYELRIGGRVIEVTPEHPLYVEGRGWTSAGEVVAGDMLSTLSLPVAGGAARSSGRATAAEGADGAWTGDASATATLEAGEWLEVESNESTGRFETVYNFRVADHHTYFVGTPAWGFGVWVHNTYLDMQRQLQELTSQTRDAFVNDPKLLQSFLNPKEIRAIEAEPWRMRLFFGSAVERRVVRLAKNDSLLSGLVHQRGNSPVDFIADGWFGFDITGGSRSSMMTHYARPQINALVTYQSIPSNFGYKWLQEIGR